MTLGTAFDADRIAELLRPFLEQALSDEQLNLFQTYLGLILKWNARFNLTAVRKPEQIVTRHFGEGVFAARFVPETAKTLMDLGSGVGIPGIPIQIMRPRLSVTLVEAQQKKASFLREAVRQLGLAATVRAERAEQIAERFDWVALRAVEKMDEVLPVAAGCLAASGRLLVLTTRAAKLESAGDFLWREIAVPREGSVLRIGERVDVPRGTSLR